ncbi:MAG: hypothetical protein HND40_11145 [Ignavibacteriota bacterium]|nr:MAG: hypothetical protein HND40_11145 [Ignavibacteriota bacterium]
MKTIIFAFTIVIFITTTIFSQPFILNIRPDRDTLDYHQISESVRVYNITAEYLQRIDLTTNETIDVFKDDEMIYNVFYLIKDSLALIAQATTWSIYDIYNNIIVKTFPAPYDCMIDAVLINNSIYGFSCDDTEYGDFKTKIFLLDLQGNGPIALCKIPFYGFDLGINCSTNGDIHFQIEDTNYVPLRDDLTILVSFSTLNNQIVNQMNLSELGSTGANGYILYKGKKGVGIILSYYNSNSVESYFRIYNFNNGSASNFIYHMGNAEPTNTIDNKYLILSETAYSAGVEYNKGNIFIYDINTTNLVKTINLPPWGNLYTFENFPNNIYYVKDIELLERQIYILKLDSIFNVLDLTSLNPSSAIVNSSGFILTVNGKGFDTVSTVYFNGQPRATTFVSDSVITAEILSSDVTAVGSFPVWVTDRYSISDTLQFSVMQVSNPNLVVSLKNSLGNQIPASNVMYYESAAGGWKDAVNNGDGTFTVVTTKPTVSIRMFYEYANQTVHNVPAQNNTYTFTTVNAAVELRNSTGNLIDQGTVQYYAGAWRSFGTTVNGVANKELLPINYSFRMIYEYVPLDKQQDISTNSTVTFSTVLCTVKVTKANGQPLSGASTKYYSGAWRDIGLTNANGEAAKELLPKSLNFRAASGNVSKDKQQDIGVNNLVEIQLP